MSTLTVSLELPRDLLGALDTPQARLGDRQGKLMALELFREGRVSSGKGAELLGVPKLEFARLLTQHGISYFTQSPDELADEVTMVEGLWVESSARAWRPGPPSTRGHLRQRQRGRSMASASQRVADA